MGDIESIYKQKQYNKWIKRMYKNSWEYKKKLHYIAKKQYPITNDYTTFF